MGFKFTTKVYVALTVVIVVSIMLSLYLPMSEQYRGLFNISGAGGIVGIIIQIFRDHMASERSKLLQSQQQDHVLAVTSHMADVTFDKHVEFCESYINALTRGLFTLWASGPSKRALDVSLELMKIRQDNPTWIPAEIDSRLIEFENGISNIGLKHYELETLSVGEERSKIIKESSDIFKVIMGIKEGDSDQLKGIAAMRVKEYLQGVLGIHELFELRKKAIKDAVSRI